MADINVERKGPSIWPWIIGLLVLALLIWAIAEMVDTDEEIAGMEGVEEVEPGVPPAAVPPAAAPEAEAPELSTLMPLGAEDIGQTVLVRGNVVGDPVQEGFWVATGPTQRDVVFVQTPAQTETGQTLQTADVQRGGQAAVRGTVQRMESAQATERMQQAQLQTQPGYQDWTVHQDVMVGSAMAQPQQPGAAGQQQPGTGQQQPGAMPGATRSDTVTGRY